MTVLHRLHPIFPHLGLWASYQDMPLKSGPTSQPLEPRPSCQDGGHGVISLSSPPTPAPGLAKVTTTQAGPPYPQVQRSSLSCQHFRYTLNVFKFSWSIGLLSTRQRPPPLSSVWWRSRLLKSKINPQPPSLPGHMNYYSSRCWKVSSPSSLAGIPQEQPGAFSWGSGAPSVWA